MVTNNTLSSVVDDHTTKIDAIRRDLAQLNTMVNARKDRLETSMSVNTAAMQTQIEKFMAIMQRGMSLTRP